MTTPFPFVAAQILTASELNSITNLPSSTKTTSYVLTIANVGSRVVMNAAGSTTITVNTSVFSAGDIVELSNIGAGTCTVTAGTATVSSAGPLAIPQYGGGRLVFTSASAAIYFPSAVTAAAPADSGLTFIKSGTFAAVSQGSVTACFSSAFTNYRIMLNFSVADGDTYFLFGTNGTISASATMTHNTIYSSSGGGNTLANTGNQNVIYARIARGITLSSNIQLDVYNPNVASPTSFNSTYGGSNTTPSGLNGSSGGSESTSTQFTDFTIRSDAHPSGSISFTYKVYGYANS